MKRLFVALLALVAVSCSTNDVELPSSTPKILNISVAPYSSIEGTTRATKTDWAAGDELYLDYVEYSETEFSNTIHKLTYDGSKWSIDNPVVIHHLGEDGYEYYMGVIYHPGFEYVKTGSDEYRFVPKGIADFGGDYDKDTDPLYITSEYIGVESVILSEDYTITFENIKSDDPRCEWNNGYQNFIRSRTNRIRIAYKPNATIKVVPSNLLYYFNNYSSGWLYGPYEITCDAEGNAFIYADWELPYEIAGEPIIPSTPSLAIYNGEADVDNDEPLRTVEFPITGEKAPHREEGGAIFAQAYSITIPYEE